MQVHRLATLVYSDQRNQKQIFYGKPFFEYLGYVDIWDEVLTYLVKWKKGIPDLPEINFDLDAQHTFEEIKDLKPLVFRKLLTNDEIFKEIILTLFPEKKTLKLLHKYFSSKTETIYKTIAHNLAQRISN